MGADADRDRGLGQLAPTYKVGPRRIVRSDGRCGSTILFDMAADESFFSNDALEAEKAVLRERMRSIRNTISPEKRRSEAERVANAGLPFPHDPALVIGGHYPTVREFDSLPLLARLFADGSPVALPTVIGEGPLVFRRWSIGEALVKGPRSIMEPASGDILFPSVLLIPLMAFDAQGYRLGYGGGHYDRTLEALRQGGTILAIGLAFDEQEVAQLPVAAHDQRLDWILTPSGARRFADKT
jgi:5-formyltetrahydrofolate cyclo-ligase